MSEQDRDAETVEAPTESESLMSGTFIFPDGSKYEGQYIEGEGGIPTRHGQGTLTNGEEQYVGDWRDDKMNGNGRYVFASSAVYEGNFENDKFYGEGRYIWPNNEREVSFFFAGSIFCLYHLTGHCDLTVEKMSTVYLIDESRNFCTI